MLGLTNILTGLTATLAIALLAASACQAQSDIPNSCVDPCSWKTEKLKELQLELDSKPMPSGQRIELRSRQQWICRWIPGTMKSDPISTFLLPEVRQEPIFESVFGDRYRQQVNWNTTDQDASDLILLEQAIAKHPDDIGIQQLHLHWLDLPFRRKFRLKTINGSATRLIQMLQSKDTSIPKNRLALEFAMYRKGRALAYRELPDVVEHTPIEHPQQLNHDIKTAFKDLMDSSGHGKPEFVLLEIRMLKRNQQHGTALELVEKFGRAIPAKWYLKKRRDLLKELNWPIPYVEAANLYAEQFPEEVAKETSRQR